LEQRILVWTKWGVILAFISMAIALLGYLDTRPMPVRIVSDASSQAAPITETAVPPAPTAVPAETGADPEPVSDRAPAALEPRVVEPRADTPRRFETPVQKKAVARAAYSQPRSPRQVWASDPEPRPVERAEVQAAQGASLEFPHVAQ
jgi:hypothetical protein